MNSSIAYDTIISQTINTIKEKPIDNIDSFDIGDMDNIKAIDSS